MKFFRLITMLILSISSLSSGRISAQEVQIFSLDGLIWDEAALENPSHPLNSLSSVDCYSICGSKYCCIAVDATTTPVGSDFADEQTAFQDAAESLTNCRQPDVSMCLPEGFVEFNGEPARLEGYGLPSSEDFAERLSLNPDAEIANTDVASWRFLFLSQIQTEEGQSFSLDAMGGKMCCETIYVPCPNSDNPNEQCKQLRCRPC